MVLELFQKPLLVLLFTLGAMSVLWFFQIRRLMILRMKRVVEVLEEELAPRDKNYLLLGYLVGFKAVYKAPRRLGDASTVWALYVQPPRHILFYLPLIHLMRSRERLEITLKLRRLAARGEAHLYDPRERPVRREVSKDLSASRPLSKRVMVVLDGKSFELVSSSDEAERYVLAIAKFFLERAGLPLFRVSFSSRLSALHIVFEPKLSGLREALGVVREITRWRSFS